MKRQLILVYALSALMLFGPESAALAGIRPADTSATGSVTKKTGKKPAPAARNGRKHRSGKKRQRQEPAQETSQDVRRRHEAAQEEISRTKTRIRENEAAVKKNLNELGKLQTDIDNGKKRVAETSAQVGVLRQQIGGLEGQIAKNENELARMRTEYLKAVKAIRAKKKGMSTLAFIFSAGSFSQSMRRMRYLRQFSQWREKQSADIGRQVESLKAQRTQLSRAKQMKDRALGEQVKAQTGLQNQYARQDAIVVELKKNGQTLRSHLVEKQQEANRLKGQVAALIAAEQQRAREEARKREEAERKAEEAARRAEEQRVAEQQARERQEAELREKELAAAETRDKTSESKKKADQPKNVSAKDTRKQTANKPKKTTHKETKKVERDVPKPQKEGDVSYASARKRKPRKPGATAQPAPSLSESTAASAPKKNAAQAASGGFENMRGSLPRPVAGAFRVTSRFGRHALPELPDVVYDNPGIDAEVNQGAAAQAVYAGRVSGVYMVPGYGTVVILNHGNYYTVYGNIAAASVKVGDMVKQGQTVGRVGADEGNPSRGSIHFEVWKNRDKLDPMQWIR